MTEDLRDAWTRASAQAYSTLADVADIKVERRADPMDEWRTPQREHAPAPVQRRLTDAEAQRLRAHLEERLKQEREIQRAVVGGVIAHERKAHRAEIDKLNRKLEDLLDVFADLLASTDRLEKSFSGSNRSGEIIDLPAHAWAAAVLDENGHKLPPEVEAEVRAIWRHVHVEEMKLKADELSRIVRFLPKTVQRRLEKLLG